VPALQLHITEVTAVYIATKMEKINPLNQDCLKKIVHKNIKIGLDQHGNSMLDSFSSNKTNMNIFHHSILKPQINSKTKTKNSKKSLFNSS